MTFRRFDFSWFIPVMMCRHTVGLNWIMRNIYFYGRKVFLWKGCRVRRLIVRKCRKMQVIIFLQRTHHQHQVFVTNTLQFCVRKFPFRWIICEGLRKYGSAKLQSQRSYRDQFDGRHYWLRFLLSQHRYHLDHGMSRARDFDLKDGVAEN